ncbi:MAG TPA: TonB-dependent receptor [Thermoanaerobaculia bacterium]|nr:TonB-dependent receptor [Thermoanaerobaculia bacterium]
MIVTARVLALLLFFSASSLYSQTSGAITGVVTSSEGAPLANVEATLIQMNRSVRTNASGSYRFDNVPPGRYLVQLYSPRWGSAVVEVEVTAGGTADAAVALDAAVHREEIVVSAAPDARIAGETYQPTQVLAHEELQLRMEPTLGETLSKSPGVTSTYFGPASSRPVIRGFGGDRIRILEEGIGTGDASNVSPDHAVTYDPITAEHIEVVRGPATLLYGSNAVGGLVNVRDERIPSVSPGVPLTGTVDLRLGTVADERSGAGSFQGSTGAFSWTLAGSLRHTDDLKIPSTGDHDDEDDGTLINSALESTSFSAGASWIGERGYLGLALGNFESTYGIPVHAHHDEHEEHSALRSAPWEEDEHAEDVVIDMNQRRLDLRGEILNPFPFFRSLRLRAGTTDYEHKELEGEEVGTTFANESLELRIEAAHREVAGFRGALGLQMSFRDFQAIGAEAFVPPSETESFALFLFEERTFGSLDFQFGARYEDQSIDADGAGATPGTPLQRDFRGLSGSVGAVWKLAPGYTLNAALSRGVRAPTAEELFSNGPHLATFSFEIGNPNLEPETSLGFDLGLNRKVGILEGEISAFYNSFDGFIYPHHTGLEIDELTLIEYEQADARFWGVEAHGDIQVWHREPDHLVLELSADWVNARLTRGENLPRIPPMRVAAGLRYTGASWWAMSEIRHTFSQNDVAAFEEPTDGFTMLNSALGYRFFLGETVHDFTVRANNLTDELARNHVSPLKEFVPLPGRDFSIAYRLTF